MKNISQFKAFVFDLDNTLYEEACYLDQVLQVFSQQQGCESDWGRMCQLWRALRADSQDLFTDLLTTLWPRRDIRQLHEDLFKLYISCDAKISPWPDALEFLYKLEDRIPCGLLTNGVVKAQENKVRCLGISSYFNSIIFSRYWGKDFEKPHDRSFRVIADELDIEPSKICFIGDNPRTDFRGANLIGGCTARLLRGPYKTMNSQVEVDIEFNHFSDLVSYL